MVGVGDDEQVGARASDDGARVLVRLERRRSLRNRAGARRDGKGVANGCNGYCAESPMRAPEQRLDVVVVRRAQTRPSWSRFMPSPSDANATGRRRGRGPI